MWLNDLVTDFKPGVKFSTIMCLIRGHTSAKSYETAEGDRGTLTGNLWCWGHQVLEGVYCRHFKLYHYAIVRIVASDYADWVTVTWVLCKHCLCSWPAAIVIMCALKSKTLHGLPGDLHLQVVLTSSNDLLLHLSFFYLVLNLVLRQY